MEEKELNKSNFNIINITLLIIESILSFAILPLQFIKMINDKGSYPDGHGGYNYYNNYYNMWDNISKDYMVLINILFATSILLNILCIIFLNKLNKKYLILAHGYFIASVIFFIVIFALYGNQARLY